MRVCFPIRENVGLNSQVYGHFGSAPAFLVVESDTGGIVSLNNMDANHEHGQCSPVKALGWQEVDCVVTGGIGVGALLKLMSNGIDVYRAGGPTVGENLELMRAEGLEKFRPGEVCSGHGQKEGCSH
ncbi:MAG: NifB/NifX family molybdenum-iron cluster-binding protein [Nitrospirota bacterium]